MLGKTMPVPRGTVRNLSVLVSGINILSRLVVSARP
jgi:hypothetical protein